MTVNDLESDQYIGLQINNYELKEKIGAGKIGGVYKALVMIIIQWHVRSFQNIS